MEKYKYIFKKILAILISLALIVSLVLNIYQHIQLNDIKVYNLDKAKENTRNHEISFLNALYDIEISKTPIRKYINNPFHIDEIIEDIQHSESFYDIASVYVDRKSYQRIGKQVSFYEAEMLILRGYVGELKTYRNNLITNDVKSEDTNEIITDLNDLRTISDWLYKKSTKKDYTLYTDDDFYNDLYKKLKSNIKIHYFQ